MRALCGSIYLPLSLFQAIGNLSPHVSLDHKVLGGVSDCTQLLAKVSNLCSSHLFVHCLQNPPHDTQPTQPTPLEKFSLDYQHKQKGLDSLQLVDQAGCRFVSTPKSKYAPNSRLKELGMLSGDDSTPPPLLYHQIDGKLLETLLFIGFKLMAAALQKVRFFFDLSMRKRGSSLESFTYFSPHDEICKLWEMGHKKVMVRYSYAAGQIVTKELWEGERLLCSKDTIMIGEEEASYWQEEALPLVCKQMIIYRAIGTEKGSDWLVFIGICRKRSESTRPPQGQVMV
ncbi:MAG: hypothetical protein Q9213_006751 [Squamulea squamosa]